METPRSVVRKLMVEAGDEPFEPELELQVELDGIPKMEDILEYVETAWRRYVAASHLAGAAHSDLEERLVDVAHKLEMALRELQ